MKAICIRENFDGKSQFFYLRQLYDINPKDSWAVHFQFEKNPGVEHPNYKFDTQRMQYVRDGELAPKEEVMPEEAFRDMGAEAEMDMLEKASGEESEYALGLSKNTKSNKK